MSAVRQPERARRAQRRGAGGRQPIAPAPVAVLAVALALLALAVAAGCGKKGPPQPPPRLIPAQTTDLTVRQTGDRLVLDLSYPAVTTSGLPLAGIEALEVLALRPPPVPPGAPAVRIDPRTFEATAAVVERLEAAELMAATRGARLVVVLDAAPGSPLGPRPEDERAMAAGATPAVAVPPAAPAGQPQPATATQPAAPATAPVPPATEPQPAAAQPPLATEPPVQPPPGETAPTATPGAPASGEPAPPPGPTPTTTPAPAGPEPMLIAIRTFGPRGNESPLSNLVAILPRTPPPPPASLVATATAGGVQLAWTGSPGVPAAAGFDVLRRRAGENAFEARVAQVSADRLEHLDASATFGDRYEYTVRTVGARDPVVESVDGPVAAVDYRDTFAPPVPGGLVALAEEGRIRLLWDRVEAPDLAGYRIYRQENDGAETELQRAPGAGSDHGDDQVRAGATYVYRVTAVDQEGNESARSEPVTATPR